MIRHVVMFRWTPEATEEQKQQVAAELRQLPALLSAAARLPRRTRPRLGQGELRVRRSGRLRRPRGVPGLPGQPGAPGDHREVHPADNRPARRCPVRVLTRTRPRQFHYPAAAAFPDSFRSPSPRPDFGEHPPPPGRQPGRARLTLLGWTGAVPDQLVLVHRVHAPLRGHPAARGVVKHVAWMVRKLNDVHPPTMHHQAPTAVPLRRTRTVPFSGWRGRSPDGDRPAR